MNKSNPFKKRNTLDASERTKILKSTTMMQSLSSKSPSNVSKNVTLKNNHLVSTLNYELLLNYTKGFFLQECSCNNINEYVNNVAEGRYSYIDWSKINSIDFDPCKPDPIYVLDKCRILKGLIVPLAKIDPEHLDRQFSFPIPITTTALCCTPPINNITQPDHHIISDNMEHHHYFPSHRNMINYSHIHSIENHPYPYPHLYKKSTNMYSLFSNLKQSGTYKENIVNYNNGTTPGCCS